MRVLGVDVGRKRIGLALSDPAAILARPWRTIAAGGSPGESAAEVAAVVADLAAGADPDPVEAVVVGLPRRLGGQDTHETASARAFAERLRELAGIAVHLQDERLTSREADERLAVRERDWRRRKAKVDAAAAAIILQDFLDRRGSREVSDAPW
jgi:putative Holliday junction resolvase